MFKLQPKLQSMDINKNTERYKFHPGHRAFANSKKNTSKTFDKYSFTETNKTNVRESLFNRVNRIPPVFFYRKISNPYKYSMTSVPEYLIKTNEEKHFLDKLYQSLTDEKDKTLLNNLINKNKTNSHNDFYKPKVVDVQNILDYKPHLYSNPFNPDLKPREIPLKEPNYILNNHEKDKNIQSEEENNNVVLNTCPNIENNTLSIEKNELNDKKIKIEDEISQGDQIKYKYKLSDVFNLKKEPVFLNKSAEKYFFKEEKIKNEKNITSPNINRIKENENNFYISSESKSDWIPNKLNKKKMGTYSSVSYNILSPMYKGYNRFITPTELNKNNLYNESPEYHRVKSISEFIDLTRVSATNTLDCFNRNINTKIPDFRFRNSVATNQLDEYRINKDLIEKPI